MIALTSSNAAKGANQMQQYSDPRPAHERPSFPDPTHEGARPPAAGAADGPSRPAPRVAVPSSLFRWVSSPPFALFDANGGLGDPLVALTFSVPFNHWDFDQYMFAAGDFSAWMVMDKGSLVDCQTIKSTAVDLPWNPVVKHSNFEAVQCSHQHGHCLCCSLLRSVFGAVLVFCCLLCYRHWRLHEQPDRHATPRATRTAAGAFLSASGHRPTSRSASR